MTKPQHGPRRVAVTNAGDVKAKHIRWLWEPFVPQGFYTDMHGDGKVGKGVLINGHFIPDLCRRGIRTLYLTAEDPPAQVCVPRFHAAGLTREEIRRVDFVDCVKRTGHDGDGKEIEIEEQFLLPDFVPELQDIVAANGYGFVYLDPVINFFSPDLNVNNQQDVKEAIGPLDTMAQATGAAVGGIRHIGKDRDKFSTHVSLGSVAWRNTARSSFLVGRNPNDPDQRVVAPNGFNYAAEGGGLSYRIRGASVRIGREKYDDVAQIYDVENCTLSADDLLVKAREGGGALKAIELLNEVFGQDGPVVESRKIHLRFSAEHIGRESLDSAAALLGVIKQKIGRHWYWALTQEALDAWWPKASAASEDT